jgi:hypothetical protein
MDMPPFLQSVGGCSKKKVSVRSFRLLAVALHQSPKVVLRAFLLVFDGRGFFNLSTDRRVKGMKGIKRIFLIL